MNSLLPCSTRYTGCAPCTATGAVMLYMCLLHQDKCRCQHRGCHHSQGSETPTTELLVHAARRNITAQPPLHFTSFIWLLPELHWE